MRKKLVVLSGAGMSAESGIQTFRDANGLWENYAIDEVATPDAWRRNPELVQRFYNERRKNVLQAQPNAAHVFLAELEKHLDVQIVTQNIDDLHERAGSTHVLHLHGNIRYAKSSGPNAEKRYYRIEGDCIPAGAVCEEGYPLRPHVVWFGEDVPLLDTAGALCREADILLVIGTSLQVYPAAGLAFVSRKEALKVVVDPNSDSLRVAPGFIRINQSAVGSIPELKRLLGLS